MSQILHSSQNRYLFDNIIIATVGHPLYQQKENILGKDGRRAPSICAKIGLSLSTCLYTVLPTAVSVSSSFNLRASFALICCLVVCSYHASVYEVIRKTSDQVSKQIYPARQWIVCPVTLMSFGCPSTLTCFDRRLYELAFSLSAQSRPSPFVKSPRWSKK